MASATKTRGRTTTLMGGDGGSIEPELSKRPMSADHKAALAKGRNQSRAVKAYLGALRDNKPKRGRKRTAETITVRLEKIRRELPDADALQELLLLQEQADLEKERDALEGAVDMETLAGGFVEHGRDYATSRGIEYDTWRKAGVPIEILKRAGITR